MMTTSVVMTMMTNSTTITTDSIIAALDDMAEGLADVPGRTPQDSQIGANLLSYVVADIHCGHPIRCIMNTMERRGVDADEARALAESLKGLALRLGAWLGRADR